MKKIAVAVMILLTVVMATRIVNATPAKVTTTDTGVTVQTKRGRVLVTPQSPYVIGVVEFPKGAKESYVPTQAIDLPGTTEYTVSETPEAVIVSTKAVSVSVNRASGEVIFSDANDKVLLRSVEMPNIPGERRLAFTAPETGNLYGAGERGHSLTLNGDTLTFYNRQNYGYGEGDSRLSQMGISVPYVVSDEGYGVLFDDYSPASLVLGDTITYASTSPNPVAAYLIFADGTLAGNTRAFTQLTGRQPLPPLWTLGYVTSKYGYHDQKEAVGVIDTLKSRGYPVDGLVLDLYWYGVETDMGRLAWDTVKWPDHKKMLADLQDRGVNVVAITQPYINKKGGIDVYKELLEKGLMVRDSRGRNHDVTIWVGESGMFDVSNPATREWLWNRLRPLTAEGIDGWWGDLGEPEVHPQTIRHANGLTAEQYHNVYGNEWSKLIYDGLRTDFPERRPMLMMRGGTTGLQRYGVFPWTTDVARSWAGLQPQVKLMLSAGLSGLGYMGSDVGGFAVDSNHPEDSELYVRWLQMGTFSPMLRTHAQHKPEPYNYSEYEEILKRFIKMRYEWLPYNYSLAIENSLTGAPLARPLNFRGNSPGKRYADVTDEYMWGNEVLVAPVMTPGAVSREVLFPEGSEWIDWYDSSKRYEGGSIATVEAPLDRIPLFVMGGSFIPQYMKPIENTAQYKPDSLTIKYFPSSTGGHRSVFYDDNHLSPTSIADNEISAGIFSGCRSDVETRIRWIPEGDFSYRQHKQIFTFEVLETPVAPQQVVIEFENSRVASHSLVPVDSLEKLGEGKWYYDASSRILYICCGRYSEPIDIIIR